MGRSVDNEEIQLIAALEKTMETLMHIDLTLSGCKNDERYVSKELRKAIEEVGSCLELLSERFSVRL